MLPSTTTGCPGTHWCPDTLLGRDPTGHHPNTHKEHAQRKILNFVICSSKSVWFSDDVTWTHHTDSMRNTARQGHFFLRRLRRLNMDARILCNLYRLTIESILTGCITAWYGSCTALNRKASQRVVKSAQHITRTEFPSMEDLYTRRCKKNNRIIKESYHPSHKLFCLLPSGRRYCSIRARTTRLRDSFIPQAITLLNSSNLP